MRINTDSNKSSDARFPRAYKDPVVIRATTFPNSVVKNDEGKVQGVYVDFAFVQGQEGVNKRTHLEPGQEGVTYEAQGKPSLANRPLYVRNADDNYVKAIDEKTRKTQYTRTVYITAEDWQNIRSVSEDSHAYRVKEGVGANGENYQRVEAVFVAPLKLDRQHDNYNRQLPIPDFQAITPVGKDVLQERFFVKGKDGVEKLDFEALNTFQTERTAEIRQEIEAQKAEMAAERETEETRAPRRTTRGRSRAQRVALDAKDVFGIDINESKVAVEETPEPEFEEPEIEME